MFKEGDRIQNTFTRLTARVVTAQTTPPDFPSGYYKFAVCFEDDAAGERHYARNGLDGTFMFSRIGMWVKIDDLPVPMEDTRDYLETLMSLRA